MNWRGSERRLTKTTSRSSGYDKIQMVGGTRPGAAGRSYGMDDLQTAASLRNLPDSLREVVGLS
jgi:hypothetical protein